NGYGQLGLGHNTTTRSPALVNTTEVVAVAAGTNHTCVVRTSQNRMQCWGDGFSGQLGTGSYLGANTPRSVVGLTGIASITAGTAHTCAVRTSGTAVCWGGN